MTNSTDTTPTAETPPEETPETPAETTEAPAPAEDTLSAEDRDALQSVVKKERAAAKSARAAAEKAESRLAELEAAELRRGVAAEKGLSEEQAQFLTGETPEEMAASADALTAAFAHKGRPRSPVERLRTGATGDTEPAESMSSLADRVLR